MSRLALLVLAASVALAAPAGAEPKGPPAAEPAMTGPAPAPTAGAPPAEGLLVPPLSPARALGTAGAVVVLAALAAAALCRRGSTVRRSATAARSGLLTWLGSWTGLADGARERIELVSRRALGPREALCLVQVGAVRLLVGVTAAQISLLARLDGAEATAEPVAAEPERRVRGEFADELERARREDEAALQDLLARSRERLARLAAATLGAGGDR